MDSIFSYSLDMSTMNDYYLLRVPEGAQVLASAVKKKAGHLVLFFSGDQESERVDIRTFRFYSDHEPLDDELGRELVHVHSCVVYDAAYHLFELVKRDDDA